MTAWITDNAGAIAESRFLHLVVHSRFYFGAKSLVGSARAAIIDTNVSPAKLPLLMYEYVYVSFFEYGAE